MNLIKQLSEIKLEDLKNIDLAELKDRALSRPDIIIDVILIGITIYATVFIYSGQKIKSEILKSETRKLEEKLTQVESLNKTEQQFKEYLANFPESIPSEQLVDKLSGFAVNRNVQILSFSPAEEKQNAYAKLTSVKINIASDSYQNIIDFIKDIETAPYALRVDKFYGALGQSPQMRRSASNDEPSMLNIDLQIGAIELNAKK